MSRPKLLVLLVLLAACAPASPGGERAPGARAAQATLPAIAVEPLDGGPKVALSEVTRGRVAIIDVWATWCEPCKGVAEKLDLLAQAKQGQDLAIVGVDAGEERAVVTSYLEGRATRYPMYLDPEFALANAVGKMSLPLVIVVDRAGSVRHVGSKVDAELVALVDRLLQER